MLTSYQISRGPSVPAVKIIKGFYHQEWEEFIEEWLDLKTKEYISVERLGGSNDKGRDIVAFITPTDKNGLYEWDNYQCKHYNHPVQPAEIYVEIGKIIYYSFLGDYPVPRKYYFVAPQSVSSGVSDLLRNPKKLKKELIINWDKKCGKHIVKGVSIDISKGTPLREYLDQFNFLIFDKVLPKTLVKEHSTHPNHISRFGGNLSDRPPVQVPQKIGNEEHNYVKKLIKVYKDHTGIVDLTPETLRDTCGEHFKRARIGFHYAEQLKNLNRDILPRGAYEDFQEEILTGIQFVPGKGFEKVTNTETQAMNTIIDSNPFKTISKPQDRVGICHQLSNDDKIVWE